MRVLIRALVFNLALLGSSADLAQNVQPAFSISISAVQPVVKAGSPIAIKITLTNTSNKKIHIYRDKGGKGEFDYTLDVRDVKGNASREKKYLRAIKGEDTGEPQIVMLESGGYFPILPGKTLEEKIAVGQLYDLSRPGS